jgi:AcrR family transcriptional regulator
MNGLSSSGTKESRVGRTGKPSQVRPYTMGARRDAVDDTRLRITEATMRLHERVGPRETTVSAIAEEAGVTRVTVYRHFPDEESLVVACSTHWRGLHPRPDPSAWAEIADPLLRVRTALEQTYGWARTAAPMMTKIQRDLDSMPAFVAQFLADDEKARVDSLSVGFRVRGRAARQLSACLAHALRVSTWESLCADGGLDDREAAALMVGAVQAALQGTSP